MRRSKTIMLQGTASGVGKSTISIGLCRLFFRKGLAPVPFKAQNLSGNTHFLPDGRQMARSQAIASAACELPPEPDMNPVLLKPFHNGCEFIINGTPVDHFDRNLCLSAVQKAYARLAEQYDIVVVEGAGSPAELNLRDGDIVNMDFAMRVKCPVILVSDIQRGGVFASLYGTISLLQPEERGLVKGIIVNNFYGDPNFFQEGRCILERLCGVPVLGVIPHLDFKLEDEDNLPGENTMTWEKISALIPKGMSPRVFQKQQFDYLADQLEHYLDVQTLIQILEGECP